MKNDTLLFSRLSFMCMIVFICLLVLGLAFLDGFLFWPRAVIRKGGECLT